MKAPLTLAAVAATAALVIGGVPSAMADEHEEPGSIPPHPHLLLIGVEFVGEGLTFSRCVDIAANRSLPLGSQHEHVHFGRAGEALFNAGNLFVPAAPAVDLPWTDCAAFQAIVG
ncbi:MAG: hypothetical protein ACSLE3_15465 [Microbacteriaceae bacterium]